MQWWCAAQGVAWEWVWRPYYGVWILIALLAGAYARVLRSAHDRTSRALSAGIGVLVLWIALDWPVGALGAGYLASVHMAQYILISQIVPPLLLAGVPAATYARLAGRPAALGAARWLTHPAAAMVVFDLTAIVTHLPGVVDTLMVSQLGSFVLDMAWLGAALLFWWPVVAPVPVRPGFPPLLRGIYLFVGTLVHNAIGIWLVLSRYPVYATYELAPPTGWVSALGDQQLAGAMMMVVGNLLTWAGITVVFFRFARADREGAELRSPRPGGSAGEGGHVPAPAS